MFSIFIFENLFLKFRFSMKNPIFKMNDGDFSIQDFVQGYLVQSRLFVVLGALGNEPQIH